MTPTVGNNESAAAGAPMAPVDEITRLGMLMESAHVQQQLAESTLNRLEAHTRGLDAVVRDEIRRSFTFECGALDEEVQKAALALRGLHRIANWRAACWTVAILTTVSSAAIAVIHYAIPSPRDIEVLRSERDALSLQIKQLSSAGGRMELRRCGEHARLCVRVDRSAPSYGDDAEYLIVKGY
jgi:hypothetical protein